MEEFMPKVVHVTDSLHGHNGVRRVIELIMTHFVSFVMVLFGPNSPDAQSLKKRFRVYLVASCKCFSKKDNYWMVKPHILHLRKQLHQIGEFLCQFEIAHLHTVSMITALSSYALSKLRVRPGIIFNVHINYRVFIRTRYKVLWPLITLVMRLVYKFHAQVADIVIMPSKRIYDEIGKGLGLVGEASKKVRFWGVPVDLDSEPPCKRRAWFDDVLGELPLAVDFIMYAGRLAPEKGLERLLRLFALVVRIFQCDLNLVIAGGGDIQYYRRYAKRLGIADRVYFLGHLPEEEVTALARRAKLGASGAPNEVQALAGLKQMACGRPIAAFWTNIIAFYIKESDGGIVLSGKLRKDAGAVASFLCEPDRLDQCGRNAAEYVADNFGPDQWEKLENIYREVELISKSRKGR